MRRIPFQQVKDHLTAQLPVPAGRNFQMIDLQDIYRTEREVFLIITPDNVHIYGSPNAQNKVWWTVFDRRKGHWGKYFRDFSEISKQLMKDLNAQYSQFYKSDLGLRMYNGLGRYLTTYHTKESQSILERATQYLKLIRPNAEAKEFVQSVRTARWIKGALTPVLLFGGIAIAGYFIDAASETDRVTTILSGLQYACSGSKELGCAGRVLNSYTSSELSQHTLKRLLTSAVRQVQSF